MLYNLNSGFGQLEANLIGSEVHPCGKTFIVCAGTHPAFNKLSQAFVPDAEGQLRIFSTVQNGVGLIQQAVNAVAAGRGDVIYIAEGSYDETVTLGTGDRNTKIIGMGGRGSVSIQPSTAGALGMVNNANDITLINVGVAGHSTATKALSNTGSRLRLFGCKLEGVSTSGSAFATGPGSVAQIAAGTAGNSGDILLSDCELAYSFNGVELITSDFGTPTQVFLQDCRLHNISGTEILGTPGAFGIGSVRNLEVLDSTFDRMEDGTKPSDFIKVDDASDTGLFSGNRFALATNAAADLKIGAKVFWATNYTEAGASVARPA